MNKPILCVDFDGVIHSYTSGWQGVDVVSDPPVPGAIEWLAECTKHFKVVIYSSRSSQRGGISAMTHWLAQHAGKHMEVMTMVEFAAEKPSAFLTIDDRAVCFEGDFSKLPPEQLREFKPWNKRGD